VDVSGLEAEARRREIERIAKEETNRGFDLAKGPLARWRLVRASEKEHALIAVMSHIISDGWSMGVLIRELAEIYRGLSRGEESRLPEIELQYADYAAWQREWERSGGLARELGYWKERLAGLSGALELPTDRPRPATQSHRGSRKALRINRELSARLKEVARKQEATLYMALLAGLDALLWRYSGQEDIAVGSPIAGRTRVELEGLIGVFVNTLVMRVEVNGEKSFEELVGRVKEAALGAYENQEAPFERVVEEVEPERAMSHSPLFQVMLVMQNTPAEEIRVEGLKLSGVEAEGETTKFDLTFRLEESGEEIEGYVEYSEDLFEEETIARMIGHYEKVLEEGSRRPERKISEVEILAEEEWRQAVKEWNRTEDDFGQVRTIHELIDIAAKANPDAIAVSSDAESISYRELSRRSNKLARLLRSLGVTAETRVAILLERGAEMIVSLLGVLKAGGAYAPLDANSPADRLTSLVEDAGADVVVTQNSLSNLISGIGRKMIRIDGDRDAIESQSEEDMPNVADPGSLVYVIYTSGSTGKPKGVAVEHNRLFNYVSSILRKLDLPPGSSYATVSTLAADLGNTAIFPALCSGGRLHVISQERVSDAEALADYFERNRIDCLKIVPSHLEALLTSPRAAAILPRERLVLGGEASSRRLIEKIESLAPSCRILNHYGPTETTVGALTCPVQSSSLGAESNSAPIGWPLANTQVYLLDSSMRPAPRGVAGEAYIGGAGVARGYLNRPDLTADRFVPDPFARRLGGRLYKTGDLCRRLPDGRIEFIGRKDNQVKLRGYRIELAEIEAALREHPEVGQAAVLAAQGRTAEKRLVGYVVYREGAIRIDAGQIKQYLREKLPEYMVPAAIMELDALPLTANGKIDRKRLPEVREEAVENEQMGGPVEEVLAELWMATLGRESAGRRESFFEAGGHSLLATQLISRVRETFKVDLGVKSLFEAPTITALAAAIETAIKEGLQLDTAPIPPAPDADHMPLSFAQQQLWIADQINPGSPFYNLPRAVRFGGGLDAQAFVRALAEITRRHGSLRTTFDVVDGRPVQRLASDSTPAVMIVDLRAVPDRERQAEVERIVREEEVSSFDLARGPLMRTALIELSDAETVVVNTMHHIISDAWSMDLLFEEVRELYEAFHNGLPSPLPELPIQYVDFAHWQRNQQAEMEKHLSYWKARLEALPVIKLSADRRPAAVVDRWGARQSFTVPREVSDALKALGRRQGATLFMTLLAAYDALLGFYTRTEDIVVGTNVAGRNRKEVERLIGFFVNQLALRADLSGNPTFAEIVGRVRDVTLEAYMRQDLPFDRLVAALQPERDGSASPLFQVKFDLLHERPALQSPKSLSLSPFGAERFVARYDLHLSMADTPDGLVGSLVYRPDLFDSATINQISQLYQSLLRIVAAEPDTRFESLKAALAGAERQEKRRRIDRLSQASLGKLRDVKRRPVSQELLVRG
jgi:amino acid adenylation domain-containing protein